MVGLRELGRSVGCICRKLQIKQEVVRVSVVSVSDGIKSAFCSGSVGFQRWRIMVTGWSFDDALKIFVPPDMYEISQGLVVLCLISSPGMITLLPTFISLPADLERPWHPKKCASGAYWASATNVRNQDAQV